MRMVVVAAHPDDETIGSGALLGRWPGAHVVHLTDGAPRNPAVVPPRWKLDRDGYREARRSELERALALAGVPPNALHCLGVPDQEASFALVALARQLAALLLQLRPALVITHPYEGGHPDHDSAAFVTSHALKLARRVPDFAPCATEMTSYHGAAGKLTVGAFLGEEFPRESEGELGREESARKARMLACFGTQEETLAPFSPAYERFRPLPQYDFSKPPHPGPLYYEMLGWSMTGERWRQLAMAAEDELLSGAPRR